MKKMVFAIMAAFLMTGTAMAQEETRENKQQMSKEEMIQRRTESMVKKYGLNEKQAADLLELNTKYADKMSARGFGGQPRAGRPQQRADRPQQRPERTEQRTDRPQQRPEQRADRAERPDSLAKGPRMQRVSPEEMKKSMEEYDAQLKTILTEEQFNVYKADREKMRTRTPRNRRDAEK